MRWPGSSAWANHSITLCHWAEPKWSELKLPLDQTFIAQTVQLFHHSAPLRQWIFSLHHHLEALGAVKVVFSRVKEGGVCRPTWGEALQQIRQVLCIQRGSRARLYVAHMLYIDYKTQESLPKKPIYSPLLDWYCLETWQCKYRNPTINSGFQQHQSDRNPLLPFGIDVNLLFHYCKSLESGVWLQLNSYLIMRP